jgi:quinol---cytochrome c reductase iron-sulfur subunit, bacillus type
LTNAHDSIYKNYVEKTQAPSMDELEKKEISRKSFLKIVAGMISAIMTSMLGWPFISFLISPFYAAKKKNNFIEMNGFKSVQIGKPAKLDFQMKVKDAFITSNVFEDVWVIKHAPNKATVFSPICTHLGCRYNWEKDIHEFVCPCHGSVFSIDGKVLAGPAPRPLDTLPCKIENDKLYVKWELFKPGIPEKIEI